MKSPVLLSSGCEFCFDKNLGHFALTKGLHDIFLALLVGEAQCASSTEHFQNS